MARQVGTVTIANGASLSDAYDIGSEYTLVGLLVPNGWTAADITLQGAVHTGAQQSSAFGGPTSFEDTLTYADLYLNPESLTTAEFKITVGTVGANGKYFVIPDGLLEGVQFLKVRSGTGTTPVAQGAARTISLVVSE